MSKTSPASQIQHLKGELNRERQAHSRTRAELQQEVDRVWRLVPSHYINLMGVYPPLRKMLHVLAEAADRQDPSRSAPIEDTMRTEFVSVGENASTSSTEAGVLTHHRARRNVKNLRDRIDHLQKRWNDELADTAYHHGQAVDASEWEYTPPTRCESCRTPVSRPHTGRPRKFCFNCSPRKEKV